MVNFKVVVHNDTETKHFFDEALGESFCSMKEGTLEHGRFHPADVRCVKCIEEYIRRTRVAYITLSTDIKQFHKTHYVIQPGKTVCGKKLPEDELIPIFLMDNTTGRATCQKCLGSPYVASEFTDAELREKMSNIGRYSRYHTKEEASHYETRGRGRPPMYPWTEWFDGKLHVLNRGEDYVVSTENMRVLILATAKRLKINDSGKRVTTKILIEDGDDDLEGQIQVWMK